jgi:phosphopantothenoylcysteine decarboxylase/phosphopantothenate--cysteine ligase
MKILVTAGPTREFIDSVRFLSNPSSGKMGYAIARAASLKGHDVALVSGPVNLPPPPGVTFLSVVSAAEMFDAAVQCFVDCDAAVMTAAVADYAPGERFAFKRAKRREGLTLDLEPTKDICAHLGQIKGDRTVIGFAMEDQDAHRKAESKLVRKHCDAMVLNGPENIGGERATVEIFRGGGGGWTQPQSGSKAEIAAAIVEILEELTGLEEP